MEPKVMSPEALEALARRVETEEPSDELTAAVRTAFGCESKAISAPEPLTRVDDARAFCPFHWACWAMTGPKGAAGPIRNARMLAVGQPDGVLAMPGGKGTRDMIGRAQRSGVTVWRPLG